MENNNKYGAVKSDGTDSILEQRVIRWAEELGVELMKNDNRICYCEDVELRSTSLIVPQRTASKSGKKKYDRLSMKKQNKLHSRYYTPDFVYKMKGERMLFIEAKGMELTDWRLRRDMFLRYMDACRFDCVLAVVKTKKNLEDTFKLLKIGKYEDTE